MQSCTFSQKVVTCTRLWAQKPILRSESTNNFISTNRVMKRFIKLLTVAIIAFATAFSAMAQEVEKFESLTLPSVMGSNMVLQQNATNYIWGYAKPKSKITVTVDWQAKPLATKADADGLWRVAVDVPAASFDPHTIEIKCGKSESAKLENILFGEVWLCSGQSNMEFRVDRTLDFKGDLKKPMNTNIRFLCTGRISAETPQYDIPKQAKYNTTWQVCNPEELAKFSAVAYGFGKELQETLGVPVGLIDASFGGTFIEGWLKPEIIAEDAKIAIDAGKIRHKVWKGKPSHLYNANIYPIRFTTIAGTIWYQGCANVANSPRGYEHSLEVLINSWREEFRSPEMPFYVVQIAPYIYKDIRGAQLRESQAKVADKVEHCELVVTIDQQENPCDIHPRRKADVAHRLAQCALGEHYKKDVGTFRSPAYESMAVEGDKIRVRFKNVPTSLVVKGGGRINGFQLASADATNPKLLLFALAEAYIDSDNSIVVHAEGITNPVAVRYCFNEDEGNVFSAEGLPLAQFRSDDSNISHSARPYVEAPSEIAITFEGISTYKNKKGVDAPYYVKTTLREGEHMWPNLRQKFSEEYPKEFEGFEVVAGPSITKTLTAGGKITAHGDGRVYCIVRANIGDFQKIAYKTKWRALPQTYIKAVKPDGSKLASYQYIAYHDVKAGDVIELPRIKDHYSVFVLAKSINFVPTDK